jgi:acyl-coenzyme A synthetase/AMP-(fatty) acid ligase
LIHRGRNDTQIKLRGFRIELTEIEHVVREATGSPMVAVVAFPFDASGPRGVRSPESKL